MTVVAEAVSRDPHVTRRLAAALAAHLGPGDVVLLEGDLGAGKTTFVQGLVAALGGDAGAVTSPTFTLENRYDLDEGEMVHADLYRTEGRGEEDLLGSLLEARDDGAVVAVEWAAALAGVLAPCWEVEISLLPVESGGRAPRRMILKRRGPLPDPAVGAAWKEAAA
jgi:tRNA threonylcarbamoyl adenosine modification protein YjeE